MPKNQAKTASIAADEPANARGSSVQIADPQYMEGDYERLDTAIMLDGYGNFLQVAEMPTAQNDRTIKGLKSLWTNTKVCDRPELMQMDAPEFMPGGSMTGTTYGDDFRLIAANEVWRG